MDKTTQGLKTLAEYMGEKPHHSLSEKDYSFCYKYNTSWDALVQVYAKAVAEKDIITYHRSRSRAEFLTGKIYLCVKYNNPQAAFEAVVELVNLINKENNKTLNKGQ